QNNALAPDFLALRLQGMIMAPSRYPSFTGSLRGLATAGALLLAACGGGGDASPPGSGQSPDPVVVDIPIAYIERPLYHQPDPDAEAEIYRLPAPEDRLGFYPGAQLWVKNRATHEAEAVEISARAFADMPGDGRGHDIRHLSVHPEGDRLLFAMRAPA